MVTPGPSAAPNPLTHADPFSNTSKARLQALYSDFSRQKQSNPTAYRANVEWWRKSLETLVASGLQQEQDVRTGSRLVLHANRGLLDRVRIEKVGKPLALGAVINDLRSSKALISQSEFMTSKASIYDPGWLPYRIASFVVGKPLWWALEQVGIAGDEGIFSSVSQTRTERDWWGDYIFIELVEKAADAVMSLQQSKMTGPADALYTWDGFRRSFSIIFGVQNLLLDETDTKILVKYLERERKVLVVDNEAIKFVDSIASDEERNITTVDRGILELKSAVANTHDQVDGIQLKIDECTNKATTSLRQKRKTLALSYLKSRKQLEELLSKRLASLHLLEGSLRSVETAAGDIQIMKTYESSALTLRAILAHPSLQRENVDKTMDALAEARQDAQELDNAIRIGGDVALEVDAVIAEDELEEEWRTLLRDLEKETEKPGSSYIDQTPEETRAPSDVPSQAIKSDRIALPSQ